MRMTDQLIAAIKVDFADRDRGWSAMTVHEHTSSRLTLSGGDLVEVAERHVTLTVQSVAKGVAIIFMLEGPASGDFTSGRAIISGSTYSFDDAQLLKWLSNAADAAATVNASAALELFGPVESAG